ncbi:MAG: MarC family protein [Amaricoccus sp.]|uniref:MarC family protein n=1 Tax=Amaricoccus sp. TaxID=1872485 RepID=UPI0039E559F9
MDPAYGLRFFGALFAIMNPLMVLPLFLALTDRFTPADQRRTALSVTFYAAVMCAVISIAGTSILAFFGVRIDDFRIAGGLVLAIIALNMLNGAGNPAHEGGQNEAVEPTRVDAVAFYPLTFPMVIGPGTITTLLVFVQEARTPLGYAVFAGVVLFTVALLGTVLHFAAAIGEHLSATLRVIISRLMGMILLALAVGMFTAGLKALLPGLG